MSREGKPTTDSRGRNRHELMMRHESTRIATNYNDFPATCTYTDKSYIVAVVGFGSQG